MGDGIGQPSPRLVTEEHTSLFILREFQSKGRAETVFLSEKVVTLNAKLAYTYFPLEFSAILHDILCAFIAEANVLLKS
jgi:hypothetical protein